MNTRPVLSCLAASLFCLASVATADTPRVVAIGDIHGEHDGLVSILQETGLVGDDLSWSGGNAILIQTGDMTDRGPGMRRVLDLMMRLEEEASQQKGRVQPLLGNHEVMNLLGDDRYLTPEIYETFADERSEKRRKAAFKEWSRWLTRWARARDRVANITSATKESWMESHPPGLIELRKAFSQQGTYGGWLLELPVAVKVQGIFFQHAGLNPDLATIELTELNRTAREQIVAFIEARDAAVVAGAIPPLATLRQVRSLCRPSTDTEVPESEVPKKEQQAIHRLSAALDGVERWLMSPDCPMWYRGYATPESGSEQALGDEALAVHLDHLTRTHGTPKFVSGHSVQEKGKIQSRLSGRLFLIDTGMLASHYGGRPAALVVEEGRLYAVYPGEERQMLGEPPATAPASDEALKD